MPILVYYTHLDQSVLFETGTVLERLKLEHASYRRSFRGVLMQLHNKNLGRLVRYCGDRSWSVDCIVADTILDLDSIDSALITGPPIFRPKL